DAGHAVGRQRNVREPYAGMDGEVVDALLALLDQRVAVELPGELDGIAAALLQRLIDRDRADRHGRVSQDPFARVVDIPAGGEVHHRVGAPADRPHHLLDLLLDGGRDGRVADIRVDLHQEVPADDHRLELGVIDIRWDDGAPTGDLVAHELRRDVLRNGGTEALPFAERRLGPLKRRLAAQVLAVGDVDHLLGDDAGAGILELRQGRFRSPRFNGERVRVRVRGRNWRCDLQLPLTPALSP